MWNRQVDELLKTNTQESNNLKFQLVVLGLLTVYFLTTYFHLDQLGNVLALLTFVVYIMYLGLDYYNTTTTGSNEILEYKLNAIQSTLYTYTEEYLNRIRFSNNRFQMSKQIYKSILKRMETLWLYMDAKLVHFLYSLMFLYKYNEDSFVEMVLCTNGILKIRGELEEFYNENGYLPENVYYLSESAEELKVKALNFAHTFIYKIPKTYDLENMIEKILDRFHQLLKPHIIAIKKMTIKHTIQTGINRTTNFVDMNDHQANPMDTNLQKHINSKYNKTYTQVEQQNRFEIYI